jgi:serine protease Do
MKRTKLVQLISLGGCLVALDSLNSNASPNLDLVRQLNQAFIEVAEKVSPSVVVINVTEKPSTGPSDKDEDASGDSADSLPPGFWRRFHRQFDDQMPEQGQASGVIIRKDGYILTNRHVVQDAEKIEVRLHDGRTFKATVRGVDPQSDVAVLKIEANNLPAAKLADSSKLRVGEFAVAIGAPFNLDYSVTYGHISAKSRANVVPALLGGQAMDQDFIQTDANINPGNSGGPLVNINGEVVGINTLIRGLHTGIGFAIPINLAKEISEKLIIDGKFTRAWLGIGIRGVKDYADYRELVPGITDGVIVLSIAPNGPSAKSGLRASDVITAVDGKPVSTSQQLRNEVRGKAIDRAVNLDVVRNGKRIQVKVKPGEYVDQSVVIAKNESVPEKAAPTGIGITVDALTREIADQFGVNTAEGVVVSSVDQKSAAARKGIKPGDIITSIVTFGNAQQTITSPKEFSEALKQADLKKGVIVNLISGHTARFEILKDGNE